jgi:hypothetical protein
MIRPTLNFLLLWLLLSIRAAMAQDEAPADTSPADAMKKRFPQPVVVGTLIGRTVLEPLESQPILGHIDRVVRVDNDKIKVVMRYGGVLGFGTRPIAVPVEAMALLGEYMEVVGVKPEQLATFPTYDGAGATPLAPDAIIEVGLARPSH